MILNPTNSVINDSQKISELRKLTQVTKHQENTWIPIAQYNSRTGSYVNAAINLQAITSYVTNNSYSYLAYEFGEDWRKLRNIPNYTTHTELQENVRNSNIGNSIVSYTFTYTLSQFNWQIVNGSIIPGYRPPLTMDEIYEGKTQELTPEDFIDKYNYIEVIYNG